MAGQQGFPCFGEKESPLVVVMIHVRSCFCWNCVYRLCQEHCTTTVKKKKKKKKNRVDEKFPIIKITGQRVHDYSNKPPKYNSSSSSSDNSNKKKMTD